MWRNWRHRSCNCWNAKRRSTGQRVTSRRRRGWGCASVIRIRDPGPGIPFAQRDKVFQLYFTTKVRGTGIGLAMTFRAVQLHGGTIEIEDGSGEGTTFLVTLPVTGNGGIG